MNTITIRSALWLGILILAASASHLRAAMTLSPSLFSSNFEIISHLGGAAHHAAVENDRLYVAGGSGLQIYDLGRPASPVLLGEIILPEPVEIPGPERIVSGSAQEETIGRIRKGILEYLAS